jgi:MFS family permease
LSTVTAERVPLFSSLAVRNYRLFWVGGFISNIGTWMARIAQDWLVLTILTNNSAIALGIVTGLQFLPTAVLSPWGGSLADRFPKRKVLLLTQSALLLTATLLAVLVLGGWVSLWHVYALALLQGIAAAFDTPARQAFAPEMVPARLIGNSVGLNISSFHGARLIGPAVAGLSIAAWGVGPSLALNAASFFAVLLALVAMNPAELTSAPGGRSSGGVRDGLRYVRRRPDIMLVMFLVFMIGTFGMNFQIANALMATSVFGVGAQEFGYMSSVAAIGSLIAGLVAAGRTRVPMRLIVSAAAAFSLSLVALALAPNFYTYLVLLFFAGLTSLTTLAAANASVQLATDPAMRGRVMALYMAIFLGGTPIGSPLMGWIGDAWGPRWTLAVGGVACAIAVVVAMVYLLRRRGWEWPWRIARDQAYVALPEDVR